MQCTRCDQEDFMVLRLDSEGQVCCLDCLTRNDFRTLTVGKLRECDQCGNTESLWYTRQEDGTDLCLCCKQKQDSHNAMAWMAELERIFVPQDWTEALQTLPVQDEDADQLYAA